MPIPDESSAMAGKPVGVPDAHFISSGLGIE